MKIKFCGAARTVTGSSHLIELNDGYKILLDCGLFQGKRAYVDEWNRSFYFNPAEINCLILSHAHIDHSGRIPKLVKDGFKGKIYCTPATRDLSEIMLLDSGHIQEKDSEYHNKLRAKKNLPPLEPLYKAIDVAAVIPHFFEVDYEKHFEIKPGVSFLFRDNGHILGSASIVLKVNDGGKETSIGFTGDIGRPDRPILKDPITMDEVDYLITESTYGARIHESTPEDLQRFKQIIVDTCVRNQGKIIIPAFSLGRTQEIVYMLDKLKKQNEINHVPVFVDSPLSTNATAVYLKHPECFDNEILNYMKSDSNPFGFNDLTYISEVAQSKALNTSATSSIIISASGMAEAGRIVHHISNNMGNKNNTILIVGYCAEQSLGWKIRNHEEFIKIFGEVKKLNARVEIMDSFSAHGDRNEMFNFLKPLNTQRLKQTFIVHGDYEEAQIPFKDFLLKNNFKNISIPEPGSEVEIN